MTSTCSGTTITSWRNWRARRPISPSRIRWRKPAAATARSWSRGGAREARSTISPAMAATSSFDITSPVDFQEVDNALNQARKEVGQRYDFKGAKADILLSSVEKTLTLVADDEFKMN